MKITATDKTIHEIAKIEVYRINKLIELNAIDVNEIDLNHIDVSKVTNMNELFMNMEFKKPLNINSWDFYSVTSFHFFESLTGDIKSWDVK
jgi:hypothetical protein